MQSTGIDLGSIRHRTLSGMRAFLSEHAKLPGGSKVFIAATRECALLAAGLSMAAKQASLEPEIEFFEPVHDPGFEGRLARLTNAFKHDSSASAALISLEQHTLSHQDVFDRCTSKNLAPGKTLSVFRIMAACEEFFEDCTGVSAAELSRRNNTVIRILSRARRFRLLTDAGSDLTVELQPTRYSWISNRGEWAPGRQVVLPAGEASAFTPVMEGTFVADSALFLNSTVDWDPRLHDHVIRCGIEGGRLVSWSCDDPRVSELLERVFREPNGKRVGELGFGTNPSLACALPRNSQLNERRVGIHLGFGQHNQHPSVLDWSSPVHLDLIAEGGRAISEDGRLILDLHHLDDFSTEADAGPSRGENRECCEPSRLGDIGFGLGSR